MANAELRMPATSFTYRLRKLCSALQLCPSSSCSASWRQCDPTQCWPHHGLVQEAPRLHQKSKGEQISNKAVHLETGQVRCADKALFGHALYVAAPMQPMQLSLCNHCGQWFCAAATSLSCSYFAFLATLMLAV